MTATRSAAFLAGTFNLAHELGQKLDASDCQELIDALVKAKAEIELTSKLPDMQELLAKHPCKRGAERCVSPLHATSRKALGYEPSPTDHALVAYFNAHPEVSKD